MVKFISKPIITTQTIGERLTKTRQGSALSLSLVARRIGVKENYLVAIEAGRYNELPGDIYALEFVKAYARLLRLNERDVIREYLAERAAGSGAVKAQAASDRKRERWADRVREYQAGLAKCLVALAGLTVVAVGLNFVRGAWQPPRLEVFSPTAYYETIGSLVVLSGQTAPGSSLFINNESVFVDERGAFNETVNGPAGVSLFKITARDSAGRERVVYRTVNIKTGGQVAGASTTREKF